MAASVLNMTFAYTSAPLRTLTTDMRREWAEEFRGAFSKVISGEATTGSYLTVVDGASVASGTIAFGGTGTAGKVVVVGGTTFTAVASNPGANEYLIGATATATATDLARSMNASTTAAFQGLVRVSDGGAGTLTLYSAAAGPVGNLITITTDDGAVTVSAALSGGASNATKYLAY